MKNDKIDKMGTNKTGKKKHIWKERSAAEKFLLCYAILVSFLFVFFLLRAKKTEFTYERFGTGVGEEVVLETGDSIDMIFEVHRHDAVGLMLNHFSFDGNSYSDDEHLTFEILDEQSGEILQTTDYYLRNHKTDNENIFVPFRGKVGKGARLRLRVIATELGTAYESITETVGDESITRYEEKNKTVLFWLSESKDLDNTTSFQLRNEETLFKEGVPEGLSFCAELYSAHETRDWLKPALLYIALLLMGYFLWVINRDLGLTFFRLRSAESKKEPCEKTNGSMKGFLVQMALLVLGCLLFWEFIYTYTADKWSQNSSIEIVTMEVDAEEIRLNAESAVEQTVIPVKDDFSGVGIHVDFHGETEGAILYSVLDGKGALLFSGSASVDEPEYLTDITTPHPQNSVINRMRTDYLGLRFPETLPGGNGEEYTIQLRADTPNQKTTVFSSDEGVCTLSLHKDNGYLNKLFILMSLVSSVGAVFLLMMIRFFRWKVTKVFLVGALILGFVFSILLPPYTVPDEGAHIDVAYRISNTWLGVENETQPTMIYKRQCDIQPWKAKTIDTTEDLYRELDADLFKTASNTDLVLTYAHNPISNATIFNYAPTAIGYTIARVLKLNYITMLYLGRWLNLLALSLLMALAVHIIPVGKTVLAAIGMLPVCQQLFASSSYDGLIIATVCIFIAALTRAMSNEKASFVDFAVLIASSGLLASFKGGVYLPLVGMTLLIPLRKTGNRRPWWKLALGTAFCSILLFATKHSGKILDMFSQKAHTAVRGEGGILTYTLGYFKAHPKDLVRVYQNTLRVKGDRLLGESLGANLGRLNIYVPWFVLIAFVILILYSVLKLRGTETFYSNKQRVLVLFLCLISTGLIMTSMLFSWTPLKTPFVEGLQGRYFLPVLIPIVLMLRNNRVVLEKKSSARIVLLAMILNLFAIGNALYSILSY